MPFTVSVKVPLTGVPHGKLLTTPQSAKKELPTLHAPGFSCGVHVIVIGAPTITNPPTARVDENAYTVGMLGSGRNVSNCRKQTGEQKDGCRSGFSLGFIVTSPLGCRTATVNGTESQNADRVAKKNKAARETSFILSPLNRRIENYPV
jgi:hypothetical protein